METLSPAPDELVVRRPAARPADAGEWTLVDAASDTWLLRTGATRARDGWRRASGALGAGDSALPVLRDRDGIPHYPTGEVTVRFAQAPDDAALRAFTRTHRVTLARRNALEPRQAVFVPIAARREWLPDLVGRLAAAPGVTRAWPNTVSRYERA